MKIKKYLVTTEEFNKHTVKEVNVRLTHISNEAVWGILYTPGNYVFGTFVFFTKGAYVEIESIPEHYPLITTIFKGEWSK